MAKAEALAGQCSGILAAYAMEHHAGEFPARDEFVFGPTADGRHHHRIREDNARLDAMLAALAEDGYEETDADRELRAMRYEAERELAESEKEKN